MSEEGFTFGRPVMSKEEDGERFVMDVADMTDADIEDLVETMLDYQDQAFRASRGTPGI